jgi:ribosomal protein S18 acetylase RimI-like enzyme
VDIFPFIGQCDVSNFTCGDEPHHADLNDFLKSDALRYSATSMSQTYVAVEDEIVVGYVTLLVDAIWLNPDEKSGFEKADVPPAQTVPALKVGRLARLRSCKVPLVGSALMRFAFDRLIDVSERAGCRLLSVDAIPSAVSFYEKLGFVRNLHFNHAGKKRETTSMRFDAFSPTRPDWTRHVPLMRPEQPADQRTQQTARTGRSGAA